MFESLEGEQLQPYMDAIELEGNAAQPMDEGDGEEKVRQQPPSSMGMCDHPSRRRREQVMRTTFLLGARVLGGVYNT